MNALWLRVAVAAAFVLGGVASSPAAAAGATPVTVNLTLCLIDGGSEVVPAGAPIIVQPSGFAEGTHGLITAFFGKEQTTLTVTRARTTTIADISATWSAPEQLDKHLWVTHPSPYDLGSLESGTSVSVTETISFAQPLLVAFPPVTQGGENGPFLIHGEPPISCDIQTW